MSEPAIEKRIRRSALWIGAGLAVQVATLMRTHPLSFVIFLGLGVPLVVLGVFTYLRAVLAFGTRSEASKAARASEPH